MKLCLGLVATFIVLYLTSTVLSSSVPQVTVIRTERSASKEQSSEEQKPVGHQLKLPLDRSNCTFKYSRVPLPLCLPYYRKDKDGNCMKIVALQMICPERNGVNKGDESEDNETES